MKLLLKLLIILPAIFAPPNDDDIEIVLEKKGTIAFLKSSDTDLCDAEWKFDGGGSCVKVFAPAQQWASAKLECEANNATLAVPTDHAIQDMILLERSIRNVWIGLRRTAGGRWTNSADLDTSGLINIDGGRVTFADWHKDHPSTDMSEQCIKLTNMAPVINSEIDRSLLHWRTVDYAPGWRTAHCEEKLDFVCQKKVKKSPPAPCRTGWTADGDGKCYQLSENMHSWNDAECACNKLGGHLADLKDRSYDTILRKLPVSRSGIWIGYRRRALDPEGTVRWMDTNDGVLGYSNWLPTQPKNLGTQSCAQLLNVGLTGPFRETFSYPAKFVPGWADQDCKEKQYYVCQYQIDTGFQEIPCSDCRKPVGSLLLAVLLYIITY